MTKKEMQQLKLGDIVRPSGQSTASFFVVCENYENFIVVSRSLAIKHPEQWDLVLKRSQ